MTDDEARALRARVDNALARRKVDMAKKTKPAPKPMPKGKGKGKGC